MSRAIEEMLDVVWRLAAVGTYLGGPGFGCTHRLEITADVVGRNRVQWSAAQLSNESALPRKTDSTP